MIVTLKNVLCNIMSFSIAFVPLMGLFVLHECSSTGFFISTRLSCSNGSGNASMMTPAWSRIWIVVYYYVIAKYCTLIEPPENVIKAS
jgi:hypothetical protein